jgi:hypothetical protein
MYAFPSVLYRYPSVNLGGQVNYDSVGRRILATLSEDDEQRYLWQFILDTKTEEVEQELRKHDISLAVVYTTHQYCVTFDQNNTNVKDDISKYAFPSVLYRYPSVNLGGQVNYDSVGRRQLPMCLPVMSRSRVLDRLF